MRRCDACGVEFSGSLERCPLCQEPLVGEPSDPIFPYNIRRMSDRLVARILSIATVAGMLVLVLLEYGFTGSLIYGFPICLALLTTYMLTLYVLNNYRDALIVMARYFLFLLLISILWFLLTRNLVVTTYVIPIICMVTLVYNSVVIIVLRGRYIEDYAKYIFFDIVIGLFPLVPVFLNLTTVNIIAIVSVILDVVFLLGLMVFMREELLYEIKKLFSA